MPTVKQIFWTALISVAVTVALNHVAARVPAVAKLTANG